MKEEDRIAKVYRISQEGVSVKETAGKMKPSKRMIRAHIWRMNSPEKYKTLGKRYFEKKARKENPALKTEK